MPQGRAGHEKLSGRQGSRGSGRDTQASRQGGSGRGGEAGSEWEAQQSGQGSDGQRHRSPTLNITTSALRGLGQFYDMQAATARLMLRAQVRAASAFGLPDYSRIFEVEDDRARRLFSSATENLVNFVEQEEEIFNEVPTQVFRLMEKQAIDATERLKYGLEELEHQATESVEELRELSRRQAEEFAQATESFAEAAQNAMRESGEQAREAMRQGTNGSQPRGQAMGQEADDTSEEETDESDEQGAEGSREHRERGHRGSESRHGSERSTRSRKAA